MNTVATDMRSTLKKQMKENAEKLFVFCLSASHNTLSSNFQGVAGFLDWYLHGQVSNLMLKEKVDSNEFCLIPGKPSFLFLYKDKNLDSRKLATKVHSLNISEIVLCESTFPEDFLAKVKENLTKQNIRWIKLELDSA